MQPTRRAGFLAQGLVSLEGYSRAADWGRWAVLPGAAQKENEVKRKDFRVLIASPQ
jgi:hypothetical protein